VTPERHIVALGGDGFADESRLLLDFVLGLGPSGRPRVCFLPTASGDSDSHIVRFYDAFASRGCEPSHVKLFGTPQRDAVREHLVSRDVVYVGGGNTANLLAVWRLHGVDRALREAWEGGVVLAGASAGANCWFEACTTDSFGPIGPLADGLGFLPGSFTPHYDAEPDRQPALLTLVGEGFPAGYAADDGVGFHFTGTQLEEAVSSRRDGRAFRVELTSGGLRETPITVRLLG
jgi:dipeptidase E